jgi:hypothetical protein
MRRCALCVFKTHYLDRRCAVAKYRIFMQIQFSDHTRSSIGSVSEAGCVPVCWLRVVALGDRTACSWDALLATVAGSRGTVRDIRRRSSTCADGTRHVSAAGILAHCTQPGLGDSETVGKSRDNKSIKKSSSVSLRMNLRANLEVWTRLEDLPRSSYYRGSHVFSFTSQTRST